MNLLKLLKMLKKNPRFIVLGILVIFAAIFVIAKTANFYPFLFNLLFNKDINLKQVNPHKLNILILGVGGGNHEGPNLTDTIMLASIDEEKNKLTLTSLPRDLWIPELSGSNKKINTAYSYGELKRKGGGLKLTEAVVRKVTGQNIDYGIKIDFSGFVAAVDIIGGLDINVENTLDDYAYPLSGKEDDTCGNSDENIKEFIATGPAELEIQEKFSCRYTRLHFDKGPTHMDGETALKFVRSRHALGLEGSDFARSRRQQQIISAFKNKVFSAETLVNPVKLINLYNTIKSSIDTDIKYEELDDFVKLAQKMSKSKVESVVIDYGDESSQRDGLLLEAPISEEYNYLSVLVPRVGNGNFSEISKYIACEIEQGNCRVTQTPK